MAIDQIKKYIPDENAFYRDYYHYFLYALAACIFLVLVSVLLLLHMLNSRPAPTYSAATPDGKKMQLIATTEPNLLPDTIIRFASKAVLIAYTFGFNNYNERLSAARPYFTDAGWAGFRTGIGSLVNSISANKLFVNGVVVGTPVISNQGDLPGRGYVWRVQIPFLITYQSSSVTSKHSYMISVTLVRVPTSVNPQGIGIDQFETA